MFDKSRNLQVPGFYIYCFKFKFIGEINTFSAQTNKGHVWKTKKHPPTSTDTCIILAQAYFGLLILVFKVFTGYLNSPIKNIYAPSCSPQFANE